MEKFYITFLSFAIIDLILVGTTCTCVTLLAIKILKGKIKLGVKK